MTQDTTLQASRGRRNERARGRILSNRKGRAASPRGDGSMGRVAPKAGASKGGGESKDRTAAGRRRPFWLGPV